MDGAVPRRGISGSSPITAHVVQTCLLCHLPSSWLCWSQYSSSSSSLRSSPGSAARFSRNSSVNISVLFDITDGTVPQFCSFYLRLFHSKLIARQHELKTTTWSTKAQLMATSAQDHFAKWAKLKRSVDKGFQDLETTSMFPPGTHHPCQD